jgi:dehydrogenase/reductase SDR family protein 12
VAAMSLSTGRLRPGTSLLAGVVDGLLEASVFGSFSRIGFACRSRIGRWDELPRLEGKVIVVTGASSGIGRAVALELARLGADLWLVGRDEQRLEAAQRTAIACRGGGRVTTARVDLVDPDAVDSFARRLSGSENRLDGLIHNAGALFTDYGTAPDGTELTLATHLLAPFRLSYRLAPLLRHAPSSVIVTVSSGGMYTQRFDLDQLELTAGTYRGVTAYARAKRAQVVLAHEWARRWGADGLASYAMHPGWVETPGLATNLPAFARLGPLLRSPEQGADTVVWLAADGPRHQAATSTPSLATLERCGGVWLDRHCRHEYYLPTTYRRPAHRRREGKALWAWCTERTTRDSRSPRL